MWSRAHKYGALPGVRWKKDLESWAESPSLTLWPGWGLAGGILGVWGLGLEAPRVSKVTLRAAHVTTSQGRKGLSFPGASRIKEICLPAKRGKTQASLYCSGQNLPGEFLTMALHHMEVAYANIKEKEVRITTLETTNLTLWQKSIIRDFLRFAKYKEIHNSEII